MRSESTEPAALLLPTSKDRILRVARTETRARRPSLCIALFSTKNSSHHPQATLTEDPPGPSTGIHSNPLEHTRIHRVDANPDGRSFPRSSPPFIFTTLPTVPACKDSPGGRRRVVYTLWARLYSSSANSCSGVRASSTWRTREWRANAEECENAPRAQSFSLLPGGSLKLLKAPPGQYPRLK